MNHEYERNRANSPAATSNHEAMAVPGRSSRSALLRKSDYATASGLVQIRSVQCKSDDSAPEQADPTQQQPPEIALQDLPPDDDSSATELTGGGCGGAVGINRPHTVDINGVRIWRDAAPSALGRGSGAGQLRHTAAIARQYVVDDPGDPEHPMVQEALHQRGSGSPLPDGVRGEMEARLGVELARVRVHTDDVAEQAALAVNARAFTVGEDIYFAAGAFAPDTAVGAQLLAHELTHVVQGREGRIPHASGVEVSRPGDALEREAEATSHSATRGTLGASGTVAAAEASSSPGALLHRTPEEPEALINRHTSRGNLDETALGRALVRWATDGQLSLADQVLTALGSTDRDDVAYEFMATISDLQLTQLATQATGRRFLDRLFDELTSGSVAAEEEQQAARLLQANARQTVGIGAFDRAATSRGTKIFPFRLPGFTVPSDAPIQAERRRGGVWCRSFVRVLGIDEFSAETRTLPTEYFLGGIVLPENEVIGVRLYDQGGIIHHTTPLFLIQLANATNQQVLEKILETAGIGLALGPGALAGLGIEASLATRVLLWADCAAIVLGTLTSVLREHRAWLVETFGHGFMDAVDIVHSACAIYGVARVALEALRIISGLRDSYRAFRDAARARSSEFSHSEQATVQSVTESTDELLQQVEQIQGARRPTDGSGGSEAVGESAARQGGAPPAAHEHGPANPRASSRVRSEREATAGARQPPMTESQVQMARRLREEHSGLSEGCAADAVQGAESVGGSHAPGADIRLLNGGGREVSVHSGAFTDQGMAAHLQAEAAQAGTTEIYMQINSAGATREGMIHMAHAIRSGYLELGGMHVRFYGPNGEVWWAGTFRSPR